MLAKAINDCAFKIRPKLLTIFSSKILYSICKNQKLDSFIFSRYSDNLFLSIIKTKLNIKANIIFNVELQIELNIFNVFPWNDFKSILPPKFSIYSAIFKLSSGSINTNFCKILSLKLFIAVIICTEPDFSDNDSSHSIKVNHLLFSIFFIIENSFVIEFISLLTVGIIFENI